METHVLEYTVRISFIYYNTFLALQIPGEGLWSLLFFTFNDSKKVMRLVIIGAWGNLFLLVTDGDFVVIVDVVTICNHSSSRENFSLPRVEMGLLSIHERSFW